MRPVGRGLDRPDLNDAFFENIFDTNLLKHVFSKKKLYRIEGFKDDSS